MQMILSVWREPECHAAAALAARRGWAGYGRTDGLEVGSPAGPLGPNLELGASNLNCCLGLNSCRKAE